MPTRAAKGKLSQRLYYGPKAQLLRYISDQENIDTTTPTCELIFHVMASLAQLESALISQCVHAGMARAKAQDKHVARPRLAQAKREAIAQLVREGLSMNQVSKQLDVAYGTVYNYAQKLKST
jgi:DNA invertase Pin-like site-specific DNA recombinase